MITLLLGAGTMAATDQQISRSHEIEIDQPILVPDDGLLLGNGDLSVSVYQSADRIIWRFGKGDVWDRRLDLSDDPKPAHIDEVARGIEVEGWKCPPYGGPVEATRGAADPKRMREICQGVSPSYSKRPYPCPKPVGELAFHLPPDLGTPRIRQRLVIEEAKLLIECSWPSGLTINLESFIPPKPNVLVVRWNVSNWNAQTRLGIEAETPIWFSLYRWADPSNDVTATRVWGEVRHGSLDSTQAPPPNVTPLSPPTTKQEGDLWAIEQTFFPDPLYQEGFRYLLAPLLKQGSAGPVNTAAIHEARLRVLPAADAAEGQLVVAVPTASDPGGPSEELKRIGNELGVQASATIARWANENREAASQFWSQSSLSIADPVLERLWYETFHARRCAYRRGAVPPGLFLPSTVRDHSAWHGDYHWNYNFQQPFWGDYTANHLELGDSYFDGLAFALPIGRKIAKEYYNCRGVFVQLSTFPILAQDDPLGVVPMGRMAYVTGWAMNQYWWRYLHTQDKVWLKATGYPVMRDCALFYTDFLKKRDDGLYHAFPSNVGEDGFTGNAKDYTDRAQVMQHMRYCLRAAVRASEVLGVDEDLRAEWRDRLEHAAGDDGQSPPVLAGIEKERYEMNPPEFRFGRDPSNLVDPVWYFGKYPWALLSSMRNGEFDAERDLPTFRRWLQAWRRSNGLYPAMAIANYGRQGAWTETLGVAAPLQEMMLQSWDGVLRIFPAWPKELDARFETFRAEGAFLVSASWSKGQVATLLIRSEAGSRCRLRVPWDCGVRVEDSTGTKIDVVRDSFGCVEFETKSGVEYRVMRPD